MNSTLAPAPTTAPSNTLAKRKLAEIGRTLQRSGLQEPRSIMPSSNRVPIALLLVGCVVVLPLSIAAIVILSQRLRIALSSLYHFIRRRSRSKTEEIEEKPVLETSTDAEVVGGSTTAAQPEQGPGTIRRRGRQIPPAPKDIWTAAAQGDLESVEQFRSQSSNFDVNEVHDHWGSFLAAAARSGNPNLVAKTLQWGAKPNVEGGQYHNELQCGAHSGSIEVIRLLLSASSRDTSVGKHYGTAVNAASEKGTAEMVEVLLDHCGPDVVNIPGGLYGRPLIAAAARGQRQMVLNLLANGAGVDEINDVGTTALHVAAAGDQLDIARILLERNSALDLVSSIHATPLHAACRAGHTDIALALIDQGANPNIVDDQHRLPLHEASIKGLTEVVDAILIRDSTNINAQDSNGSTALHHAAIGGHVDVTSLLIKYGIDVSIGDKWKAHALFRAAGCHHAEVVKILLRDGKADPMARDCFGQIALHGPSETEDVIVQKLLIDYNSDINTRGAWNRTPLYEACSMGRLKNVELLLSKPEIDVNSIDDHNGTPICRALCSTDPRHKDECVNQEIPRLMVQREDLDVNLCQGLAVQEVARLGMVDVFQRMVEDRNANLHIQNGKYGGVLQAAAMGGNVEILQMVLDRKVDVNQKGGEYGSPLAAACAFGHVAVVRKLLEYGADANVRGGRYETAYASVCREEEDLKKRNKGVYEIDDIKGEIQGLLETLGGVDGGEKVEMPNLEDRWNETTGGWRWIAKGEM